MLLNKWYCRLFMYYLFNYIQKDIVLTTNDSCQRYILQRVLTLTILSQNREQTYKLRLLRIK